VLRYQTLISSAHDYVHCPDRCATGGQQADLLNGNKESGLKRAGFGLPLEGARRAPDLVSSVSAQHSAVRYQVTENMNRRTAEQETAEYRSEEYRLAAFKNFCCSKFLVRYSIFKIEKRRNATDAGYYFGELLGGVSLIARDFIFWRRVLR